jgi:hypothetical protein
MTARLNRDALNRTAQHPRKNQLINEEEEHVLDDEVAEALEELQKSRKKFRTPLREVS